MAPGLGFDTEGWLPGGVKATLRDLKMGCCQPRGPISQLGEWFHSGLLQHWQFGWHPLLGWFASGTRGYLPYFSFLQAKVFLYAFEGRVTANDPSFLTSSLGFPWWIRDGGWKAHFPKLAALGPRYQDSPPNECASRCIPRFAVLKVMGFCECLDNKDSDHWHF